MKSMSYTVVGKATAHHGYSCEQKYHLCDRSSRGPGYLTELRDNASGVQAIKVIIHQPLLASCDTDTFFLKAGGGMNDDVQAHCRAHR